jgi:diguanylate cyclase (GGDEF)-like protein/PAS domain S-box-containing protein
LNSFNDNRVDDESVAWLVDGGAMGELIRTTDWDDSVLGPITAWPLSLKNAINLCLASHLPIAIAWGSHCTHLYNDAYLPLCGAKHPASMGQDFRHCWVAAWPIIGDAFNQALAGRSQKLENKRMFLDRNGYLEETFFTCSFSPICDDTGAFAGVFYPVVETTGQMLAQRRALLIRDIALQSAKAQSVQEVFALSAEVLSENDLDIPFALFYLFDAGRTQARLVAAAGVPAGTAFSPEIVDAGSGTQVWPLFDIASELDPSLILTNIEQRFGTRFGTISCRPYPEPPNAAMLVPINTAGSEMPTGVCVFALSPRLPAEEACRRLCEQIAASIATAIDNVHDRDPANRSVATDASAQFTEVDQFAYQALLLSKQRQRCILEAGEIGAWEVDFATERVWRSPMHDHIFGYGEPLPEWTRETFHKHVVPEDRERVDREFQIALKNPTRGQTTECRIHDANGEKKWIEIHRRVKFDAYGKPERMFGTVKDVTAQLNLKNSLQQQTEILQMTLNGMSEGVIVCNADRELILVNKAAEQMLKMDGGASGSPELASNFQWFQSDGQTAYPDQNHPLLRALNGEKVLDFEAVLRHIDRSVSLIVNCSSAPLKDADGRIVGAVKVFRDVTESKIALQELRNTEQHFKLLVEGTTDYAIFMLNANGHIVSWNPGAQRILGYEEREVIGRHVSIFYTPEDIIKGEPQRKLNQTVQEGRAEEDNWRVRKDGQRFWSTGVLDALHDESGGVRGFVEIMRDNTERRLAEENTYFLANHDPLTGLANRARFMERLHEALLNADRDDTQVAVLLLDLDRFKLINDTLGHHIGDLLLKKVAMRLSKCVRETDTVARLGGDEFVLILTRLKDVESVESLAGKIVQEMCRPYHINRQEVRSGTSLGVAIYRRDGKDAGELLQKADLAMYRAKSAGRNRYRVFAPSMLTEMRIRSEQENSLRHALECQEFELSYQPQIDLNTLCISGAEVLLRNRNRVLQGIPTSKVIALAEDTGLIIPLGEWILQTTCRQMKKWQKMGLPEFKVAVNFSTTHLLAPNFIETVQRILAETGLDAKYLEIEVTEGLLVAASEANNQIMTSLKELGVSISVDDFGTGYSALSCLKNFPVDVLKIDESLVRNLPADQDDVAIVSAIIKLAADLDIRVIAEGVETVDQLTHLKTTYCNTAQGYLFSPAVNADQFETLLHGRTWTTPIFH